MILIIFYILFDYRLAAGGQKYVIHNIIFKFATADRAGLYKDDAHAAKVN